MKIKQNYLQRLAHLVSRQLFKPKLGDIYGGKSQSYHRKYHRHDASKHELAFVTIGERFFRVINISYGGLKVAGDGLKELEEFYKSKKHLQFSLVIMGSHCKMQARIVHLDKNQANFVFDPLGKIEEQFLSRFLYFMDAGILLKSIPRHSVLDIYQNPAWHSYGGLKASIEVHLNLDTQSEVVQAHIFYLNGMRRNIAIFSSHGINVSCVPQQELSSRDRRDILMHVLGILLGLRQVGRTHRLDSIIQYGLNKLLGSTQKID